MFAVYVTHGSVVIIKALANLFNKDTVNIQAKYSTVEGVGMYTISNLSAVKSVLQAYKMELSNNNLLNLHQFLYIIKLLAKHSGNSNIMLCADANLGDPASHSVSAELAALVSEIKPKYLFPFSDTPECVLDATTYLNGCVTSNGYRLTIVRVSGTASNRRDLNAHIKLAIEEQEAARIVNALSCNEYLFSCVPLFFRSNTHHHLKVHPINVLPASVENCELEITNGHDVSILRQCSMKR